MNKKKLTHERNLEMVRLRNAYYNGSDEIRGIIDTGVVYIEGFNNYVVSTGGQIISVGPNGDKPRIMSQYGRDRGYKQVNLSSNGVRKQPLVHRLVAAAFVKRGNENQNVVNHKDGNKTNNHWSNLEWVNQSENMKHSYKNNLSTPRGAAREHEEFILNEEFNYRRYGASKVFKVTLPDGSSVNVVSIGDLTKFLKTSPYTIKKTIEERDGVFLSKNDGGMYIIEDLGLVQDVYAKERIERAEGTAEEV